MAPTRYKILFVDDEPAMLAGLRRLFYREPFDLLFAESGAQALEELRRGAVDVVISDEQMPGMTGIDLLVHVQEAWPDTVRILLTGNATLGLAVRAVNEGHVFSFLTKPCPEEQLLHTVRQSLRLRELEGRVNTLMRYVEQQEDLIDNLEKRYPGITDVDMDEDGIIVVDALPAPVED